MDDVGWMFVVGMFAFGLYAMWRAVATKCDAVEPTTEGTGTMNEDSERVVRAFLDVMVASADWWRVDFDPPRYTVSIPYGYGESFTLIEAIAEALEQAATPRLRRYAEGAEG